MAGGGLRRRARHWQVNPAFANGRFLFTTVSNAKNRKFFLCFAASVCLDQIAPTVWGFGQNLMLLPETDVGAVTKALKKPALVIVDSIQTMTTP